MKHSILVFSWIFLSGIHGALAQPAPADTQENVKAEFIKTLTIINQEYAQRKGLMATGDDIKRYREIRAALESRYTPQQLEDTVVDVLKESKKNLTVYGRLALDYNSLGGHKVDRRKTIDWIKQDLLENFKSYGEGGTLYASYITQYGGEQDLDVLRQIIALIPVQTNIVNSPTKFKEEALQSLRGSLRNIVSAAEYKFKKQREETATKAASEASQSPAPPVTPSPTVTPQAPPQPSVKEIVPDAPFNLSLWVWALVLLLGLAGGMTVWRTRKR